MVYAAYVSFGREDPELLGFFESLNKAKAAIFNEKVNEDTGMFNAYI